MMPEPFVLVEKVHYEDVGMTAITESHALRLYLSGATPQQYIKISRKSRCSKSAD
jgi:hypothetical protein